MELPLRCVFDLPTVAGLAEWVESHRDEPEGVRILPIVSVSRESALALSFSQQRLWFLDQLEPESCAYNLCSAFELLGRLDVPALEWSFNEIVKRHEALRTVFKSVNGQPFQNLLPSMTITLSVVDLRDIVSQTERESAVSRLSNAESLRPFDLVRGPLLRVTLLRVTEETHVLLLAIHHIVFDGWSMGILARELSVLYKNYCGGEPSSLPELRVQYGDFALWQRAWCQGELLDAQLSYWKRQLSHLPSLLELPTDKPKPPVQTFRGARQSFVLSKTLSTELKHLSRQHGVTLFMTLLAAYQTLLHRYTGQNDIVIGSPVAGRKPREVEDLIGFFLNNLVLRVDLSEKPTFLELLARVREVCFEAYAHQDLPFEKLVEELRPERSLTHNPLFQVTFALQNTPRFPLELGSVITNDLDTGGAIARFDLHLFMVEEEGGLQGWMSYNTDIFSSETISRMVEHMQVLLQGIVTSPNQRICDLPIFTAPAKRQLLIEWNDTEREYSAGKSIHQLFEEQTERTPEAVAVVFEDRQLTYRELNNRANRLAHYLRKLGVGPEVLVGICVERSMEMVVGLLGILKAGGAYVPLDPSYPAQRLEFMLADAQATVLLTQGGLLADREAGLDGSERRSAILDPSMPQICLDRDWELIARESDANPPGQTAAEQLAYVMYTSGSTGIPKGVEVPHRAIIRLLFGVDYVELGPNQNILQLASPAFDAATFEIWGALLHGGKSVLYPEGVPSPEKLGELLHKHNVNTLWLTASLFNTIIDTAPEALSPVRQLLVGGEALSVSHVRRAIALLPNTALINGYGPTEGTTFTCCYRIPRELDDGIATIPIGRPIGNTKVYILDASLNPVPVGVPGELHIGGDGLARGYINQPELTAEKFITNPFLDDPNARLYKTGDRVRYWHDGNIEFLGRSDLQIKLRGYRIELGEIEAVLKQHGAVRECIVIADAGSSSQQSESGNRKAKIEHPESERRLVAYVVAHDVAAHSINDLRNFLIRKLPDYMVPSAFVFLESLPLTRNGKVDREALPVPDQVRPELEAIFMPPRSPVEEMLAVIWAEVLRVERIGVHDNFFDLGGHSLLATRVVSRIRRALQVEITLRAFFETPTVAGLAERIEEIPQTERKLPIFPLLPVVRDKDLPLSFAQQRLWFLDQYEPESSVYNIPSALRLAGALTVSVLEQSLQEIVNRHEVLRTTFSMVDGEAVQIIAPSLKLTLPVVDLSETAEAEREHEAQRLAKEEGRRPFDLSRGPLFRIRLLQLRKEDHVLLMTLHHSVSDGWSMGVLYRELSVLYEAFSKGKPSPLADLPIQYADFAVWQRDWLQSEVLEGQLSYWKKQLADVALMQLPD